LRSRSAFFFLFLSLSCLFNFLGKLVSVHFGCWERESLGKESKIRDFFF